MIAYICQKLEKPTRVGSTCTFEVIRGNKENILSKVQEYITWRMNAKNCIRVECFKVDIYNPRTKKSVTKFKYTPTYR